MKIEEILIQNYKSIKNIRFKPTSKINVFIGENSVGKSNIFSAINWLLGPTYPTFNHTTPEDHYLGKLENEIKINLKFSNSQTLELAEKWIDARHQEKTGLNLSGNYIKDEERKDYTAAYLGIDRKIQNYLPSNRWSLLGRILYEINKLFNIDEKLNEETGELVLKKDIFKQEIEKIRDEILFSVKDEHGIEIMKRFISILKSETAKQLNINNESLTVDLNLYDPWNFYRSLQLLVYEEDTGLKFQASELGMGVQASITIAILKAYSELNLRNNTPILIDEPELFLHPQAQRRFYKILRDLAEKNQQIFLTTHSINFLDLGHFDELFIVRKNSNDGTTIKQVSPKKIGELKNKISDRETKINEIHILADYKASYEYIGDTQKSLEAFFAKKIILVEGQADSLIIPYFLKLSGLDIVHESLTIVNTGGKGLLTDFHLLYSEFDIPLYLIFDGDSQNIGSEAESTSKKINKKISKLFNEDFEFPDGKVHSHYFGFHKRLEDELGFNTKSKGLDLYREIKQKINDTSKLPSWVFQIKEQLNLL